MNLIRSLGLLALGALASGSARAGTQDFILVNSTGSEIHDLYISESGNMSWEENLLPGASYLPNSTEMAITFSGRRACLWDLMAQEGDAQVVWEGINLCQVSAVTLHCDERNCWATYSAGTQDFTLVNFTGSEIHELYISESANTSWEENLFPGESFLPHGNQLPIAFSGRRSCLWDLMAQEDDAQAVWEGINLCEVSVVTLHCENQACYATFE